MTCPSCGRRKLGGQYLCRTCWKQLPDEAQRALYRRDRHAHRRLADLLHQIKTGTPLEEIRIEVP